MFAISIYRLLFGFRRRLGFALFDDVAVMDDLIRYPLLFYALHDSGLLWFTVWGFSAFFRRKSSKPPNEVSIKQSWNASDA